MPPFTREPRWVRGYAASQIEDFFARVATHQVSAAQARSVGFDLMRGGYQVTAVDEALDRLEDELDARERASEPLDARELAAQTQVLRARAIRRHGDRFARATGWRSGYDIADVDRLCDQISDRVDGGAALSASDVRNAVFGARRGSRAYDEAAVDAYLDRVIAVLARTTS